MRAKVSRFLADEAGEDLIEYGLLAAFAAAIATVAIISDPLAIKPALVRAYQRAKEALVNV